MSNDLRAPEGANIREFDSAELKAMGLPYEGVVEQFYVRTHDDSVVYACIIDRDGKYWRIDLEYSDIASNGDLDEWKTVKGYEVRPVRKVVRKWRAIKAAKTS